MRNYIVLILVSFWGIYTINGQNKQLLYDFQEIPQALMLNPGMQTPYQWHAGIPLISGISFQAGTSGISVNDIFAADGLDINDKVRDRAVFGLGIRDEISGVYQIEVLYGGFRGKNNPDNYFSFGIYNEGVGINYWPRDLAILGYEGNADQLGRRFNLSHLKTRGELLNVFHFGWNRVWNRSLTVGARGKIYSGILDFNSSSNEGYFVNNEGQNNILASTLVADMMLRTSGLDDIRDVINDDSIDNVSAITSIFTKRGFFGGDLGLGLDLGFTYQFNSRTYITGSLLDIGLMYHSGDIRNFTLQGEATIEGIEVILPDALADPNADFWQELVDEIEALIPFEENNNNYTTFRPVKFYGSIRHNFGGSEVSREFCDCTYQTNSKEQNLQYKNSVGAQIYAINRPRGPQAAVTAFYQRRFGNVLALKGTYTVDKFTYTNIGLGMSLQAGPVNFYLVGDNLLGYRNLAASHYASFQFGLNIISWEPN
ncbi:MAG: DUF5723 family protein [Flavobacteriaceae bacterium]